jgi:hypothetical protein
MTTEQRIFGVLTQLSQPRNTGITLVNEAIISTLVARVVSNVCRFSCKVCVIVVCL